MNTQLHHGQRLKKWIEYKKVKVIDLVKLMDLKHSNSIAYYYRQEEIRKPKLAKLCEALGITLNEFYKGPFYKTYEMPETISHEADAEYGFVPHQGKLLEKLFENNGAMVTTLAEKWKISRQSLYNYFRSEKLNDDIILKASQYFKQPTSYFNGNTKDYFKENDIWVLLQKILEMNVEMKVTLERMEQRFYSQDTTIPTGNNLVH